MRFSISLRGQWYWHFKKNQRFSIMKVYIFIIQKNYKNNNGLCIHVSFEKNKDYSFSKICIIKLSSLTLNFIDFFLILSHLLWKPYPLKNIWLKPSTRILISTRNFPLLVHKYRRLCVKPHSTLYFILSKTRSEGQFLTPVTIPKLLLPSR